MILESQEDKKETTEDQTVIDDNILKDAVLERNALDDDVKDAVIRDESVLDDDLRNGSILDTDTKAKKDRQTSPELEHENLADFLENDSAVEDSFLLPPEQARAAVEAILFACGDPVSLERIASVLGYDKDRTARILADMMEEGRQDGKRGLVIRRMDDDYTMSTKPSMDAVLQRLFLPRNRPPMTQAAYETLSIIAYNQPVTRSQVESVRGVSSDSIIVRLMEKNLIHECGTLDAPGRPTLFETTELFLKEFGLSSVRELPPMDMMMYGTLRDMETSLSTASGSDQDNQITIDQIVETILPGAKTDAESDSQNEIEHEEMMAISTALFGGMEE